MWLPAVKGTKSGPAQGGTLGGCCGDDDGNSLFGGERCLGGLAHRGGLWGFPRQLRGEIHEVCLSQGRKGRWADALLHLGLAKAERLGMCHCAEVDAAAESRS